MKPLNTFLLIAPAALLMLGVFLVPFLLLAVLSLWTLKPGTLSLDTSLTLANYARLFGDTYYLGSLWTTLWMSAVTTLACLILGLPLAQWIVRRAGRAKGLLIGLVISPMVCGALLPTLGLVNLLGPLGVVNGALKSFGLITSSLPLLGRPVGVIVGLVQAFLPQDALNITFTTLAIQQGGKLTLVDTGNGGLLLYGMHRAARPADRTHPLGHGRELYFWSLIVALLVFALVAGVSLYEGIIHILAPVPVVNAKVNYIVLGLSFLFEGSSWLVALKEFRRQKGRQGWFQAVRSSKDPSVYTVLFEDSAAMLGLIVAFVSIAASELLGMPELDGVGSIGIAIILGATAISWRAKARAC